MHLLLQASNIRFIKTEDFWLVTPEHILVLKCLNLYLLLHRFRCGFLNVHKTFHAFAFTMF